MKINELINTTDRRRWAIMGLTAALAWGMTALGVFYFSDYGLAVFCLIPVFIGAFSSILFGYSERKTYGQCFSLASRTLLLYAVGLLVFAIEGVICMVMAAPFGFLFLAVGTMLGVAVQDAKHPNTVLVALTLSVPTLMSFENRFPSTPSVFSVVTGVTVNARPEQVWDKLVAFSEITEPRSWLFKTGIAYPIRAEVKGGEGVGAVRYCHFSTGSFVEPITVWDKPNLLKFSVLEQPEPMQELSPYDLHPEHLHGYFVSQQGQFKLTDLGNGQTYLEGTTWYYHKIRPEIYWRLWTDFILHSIHERVLVHIKNDVEKR